MNAEEDYRFPYHMKRLQGTLFDIYHFENHIHLWVMDDTGKSKMFIDTYCPSIHIYGPSEIVSRFIDRLRVLQVLASEPVPEQKRLFYENRIVSVLRLSISRPSFLRILRNKLFAFYGKMDIYHSDIELPTSYMNEKGIHPMGRVQIEYPETPADPDQTMPAPLIYKIQSTENIEKMDYSIPSLKILRMGFLNGHRLGFSNDNILRFSYKNRILDVPGGDKWNVIYTLNRILSVHDPDVILTSFGDKTIFPEIFAFAQKHNIPLHLDRDTRPINTRKIIKEGTSYNTYGSWIYKAPSYPLFGRWHIDVANSFVYKESELGGVIELARLSRMPVQKLARSSTGAALTAIETRIAQEKNYLVPWQKSAVESPKSAYELLLSDKGGLVFTPDTREGFVHERVAQIDFSQMYPTIMDIHNLSPETVNCPCCKNNPKAPSVPETGNRICIRRRGVVSDSLKHLLDRRRFYKKQIKSNKSEDLEKYDPRQNSLKWMLVTSFGYLGYRNAKFGRIESHESVTAIGREKILTAKEIAEESGFQVLHAITDCLFIKEDSSLYFQNSAERQIPVEVKRKKQELLERVQFLCAVIETKTKIGIECDGIYDWIVFLPSRNDPDLPVMNRYFGRFENGTIKKRGVASRRKDTPRAIAEFQEKMLDLMRNERSIKDLKRIHSAMHELFLKERSRIRDQAIDWKRLTLRRTVSKKLEDYQVNNATMGSLQELSEMGHRIQPGEKVKYIKLNYLKTGRKSISKEKATLAFQRNRPELDVPYYERLLREAYREIWEYFCPKNYFKELEDNQGRLGF